MAKLKQTDFKKFIAQMSAEEMQDELLKLFSKKRCVLQGCFFFEKNILKNLTKSFTRSLCL